MSQFALRVSTGLFLLSVLSAPALLGANREWSVALITIGIALSTALLTLCRPALFRLGPGGALRPLRWLILAAGLIFLLGVVQLIGAATAPRGIEAVLSTPPAHLPPDRTMVYQALLGYAATCLALLFAFLIGTDRPRWRRSLLLIFLASCTLYAFYGIVTDCLLQAESCRPVAAPFVNRNNAATYFGFGLITALLLLVRSVSAGSFFSGMAGKRFRVVIVDLASALFGRAGLLAASFIVTGAALLLTQSRGGAISVALALGFAAMALWRRVGTARAVVRIGALGAVVLITVVWAAAGGGLMSRFENAPLTSDGRLGLYERSAAMIADRPLTGHGMGTFQERLPLYRTPAMGPYPDYDKAHNSYLDLAAGIGIPGAAVVVLMFAWMFGRLLERYFTSARHHVTPLVGAALIVQIGVHALVDFSMQIPGVQVNFALIAGLALAAALDKGGAARPRNGGRQGGGAKN